MNARLYVRVITDRDASRRAAEAVESERNRLRYVAQSAATVHGKRAEVPTLEQVGRDFAQVFGVRQ